MFTLLIKMLLFVINKNMIYRAIIMLWCVRKIERFFIKKFLVMSFRFLIDLGFTLCYYDNAITNSIKFSTVAILCLLN